MSNLQHLGSQLRTHKDTKVPSTCLKCQQYSHFAMNCKETSSTCGRCGDGHPTLECGSLTTIRCTPCGSSEHQTNDPMCPERQNRENALLLKDPEALMPYYATNERWTWGLPQQENLTPENPPSVLKKPLRPSHLPGSMKQSQHIPRHQGTLLGSGFQRHPAQTGANSVTITNPHRNRHTLADATATVATTLLAQPDTLPVNTSSSLSLTIVSWIKRHGERSACFLARGSPAKNVFQRALLLIAMSSTVVTGPPRTRVRLSWTQVATATPWSTATRKGLRVEGNTSKWALELSAS